MAYVIVAGDNPVKFLAIPEEQVKFMESYATPEGITVRVHTLDNQEYIYEYQGVAESLGQALHMVKTRMNDYQRYNSND